MTWQEALMGAMAMALFGVFLVVVIVQLAATWRARASAAREDAYRLLATEATAAQQKTAQQLDQALAELAVLDERTSHMTAALQRGRATWRR